MSRNRKKPFDIPTLLLGICPLALLTILTMGWMRAGIARKELMGAAQSGNITRLTALLNHGANVNEPDSSGETLLGCAAYARQYEVVKMLIDRGAEVNLRDRRHPSSALEMACWAPMPANNVLVPNTRIIKLLLDHGADPNQSNAEATPLAYLAQSHSTECALLLIEHGANVNGLLNGYPTLWYAVLNNDTPLIKALLAKGAFPNIQDTTNKETPLMQAVQNGRVPHIKLLLAHGARTDLKDRLGMTALQWAIKKKDKSVISLLKSAGAKQ